MTMGRRRHGAGELPSMPELLDFVRESPAATDTREIARAFGVAPENRSRLRAMLREIQQSGAIARNANRGLVGAAQLPEVTVIERFGSDEDGVALARPVVWPGPRPAPVLRLDETGEAGALIVGERAAARLVPRETGEIEARIIRKLGRAGKRVIGIFRDNREGGRLVPSDRRDRSEYRVAARDSAGA